jgi:hypothetical protein
VTVLWALMGMPGPILAGGGIALTITLLGTMVPSFSRFLYKAWNKIAIEFAQYASKIVTVICFYVIFLTMGTAGSAISLNFKSDRRSMWLPRSMSAGKDPESKGQGMTAYDPLHPNWILSFISWAVKTGNFWRCFLIPFIVLLASFDGSREETVPTDIYTLY